MYLRIWTINVLCNYNMIAARWLVKIIQSYYCCSDAEKHTLNINELLKIRCMYPNNYVYPIIITSYTKITFVRLSVRPLRKVGGNDLTPRHKLLYLCPWSVRSQDSAITTNGSYGTSYRHEG